MKLHIGLLAVGCCVLLSSCIKDEYVGPDLNQPKRTVIAYLGGDNNLSSTLVAEVEALRRGWTYTGNRCVIYVDPANDVPRLLSLRGGCQVTPTPYIDTLAVYSEENSASASVLRRVIKDAVRLYPADSYGLIFASHGSGWLPEGTLANPTRSIGSDSHLGESSERNGEMEIADFAAAIDDGQFDFIVFEACLMAGVEVAYELRNKTDYILASSAELLSPGFQPIYANNLMKLVRTATYQPLEAYLTKFAGSYMSYINSQSGAYKSATLSLIKTDNLETIATRTKEVFTNPSNGILNVSLLQHFDRYTLYQPSSPRYFDFMDYVEQIATPQQYSELEHLMSNTIIWKTNTEKFMEVYNGFTITKHSGLTVYIEQDCFAKLNAAYQHTAWHKATH